ncbi:DUF7261 family protein [Halospeciosus flavus]|uniref:Uncharacterized protein n=1 Tax=Halospeciosus flavus TaxID=3032283 RepID=A0ABD5Z5P3_9EURY|nr:hypothetical protein [Halospeciosus flavus]
MSDSPVAEPPAIPPPVPPGDADAWYAPDVRQQYEVLPDVVVTLRTDGDGVRYDVREPPVSVADRAAAGRVADYFADAHASPPVTREGTVERARTGLSEKHRRVVARLTDRSRAGRRRLGYAVLCEQRCLGALTPFALFERVDAFRTALDPHLDGLRTASLDDGTAIRVERNESTAVAWRRAHCPRGEGRRFGGCQAIDGVVVQNRAGQTHVLAAAFDVRVVAPAGTTRLTVVVRRW